jgi:predicted nucleic acid-binding Zn ribbon protein
VSYRRCQTCGRYMQSAAKFCSDECAVRFAACETCGNYFPQGHGYSDRYCSADCAVQYKTNRSGDGRGRPAGSLVEEPL